MRTAGVGAVLLALAGLLIAAPAPALASGTTQAPSGSVTVELDRARVEAGPGEKVRFTSTLTNRSGEERTRLLAHLSILTSDPGVYVDPEDWSAERTQHVTALPAGGAADLTWEVQAVTSGPIVLMVTVTDPARGTADVSAPLRMSVGGQRVVDAAGVAPLVLWPPAVVLAILGVTFLRRRRHR